jgi:serine protease Do
VILQIDNTPIIDVQSLGNVLLSKSPGDTVAVTINRGGQQMTVNVTLGELPANS